MTFGSLEISIVYLLREDGRDIFEYMTKYCIRNVGIYIYVFISIRINMAASDFREV